MKKTPRGNIDGFKEGNRTAFNNLLLLQAHSLELAGRWDAALSVYEALYGFNPKLEPENYAWARLRRAYACNASQDLAPLFCQILSRYDLSGEKVEGVIESGKVLREKANPILMKCGVCGFLLARRKMAN